jgi:arylsulfatase A-like enzyme
LCHEGIQFSRAYADCPICMPSRVTIMSGRGVFGHGLAGNAGDGGTARVLSYDNTLPAYLHARGYHTAAIGKMHFSPQRNRHGFDEMIIPEDYYRWIRTTPHRAMVHGMGQCELEPAMATVPEAYTLTSWIAEQCVEYIVHRRDPSRPFFLWCSFSKPHPPFDPPEPYYSMYRGCQIPEPVVGGWARADPRTWPSFYRRVMQSQFSDLWTPEVIREMRSAYYGLITQCDYNMGRVFSALQDVGLFQDTLILYTSDHGEYLSDHRGVGKGFFHEVSAHVPMVLRLPKSWENRHHGTVCDKLVTLSDVLPTFLAAAGGEPPATCDGQDLVALARGEATPRDAVESTAGRVDNPWHLSMTDGRWKYMYYPEGAAEQLFDLENDPYELHDLSTSPAHEAKRQEMREWMMRRHVERDSPYLRDGKLPVLPRPDESERDIRNQRWAGYHTDYYPVDVRH